MVLHVEMPDRPGALGAIASRVGAVGANITDVIVAGHHDELVEDAFHVTLPEARVDVLRLLHEEIREVDGASITAVTSCDGSCAG